MPSDKSLGATLVDLGQNENYFCSTANELARELSRVVPASSFPVIKVKP
jgi:hypothetical protein